jgi:lysophospholipase L1-like esterase
MHVPPLTHFLPITTLLSTTHATLYTALGDSYAAGDGAGSPRLPPHRDFGCGRFSAAYPAQISGNFSLLIPPSHFNNLACGGATTDTVRLSQVPWALVSDGDDGDGKVVVTVTVGGNEVDFFVLLNACVFGWLPSSVSCEEELVRAGELVVSDAFLRRFQELAGAVVRRTAGAQGPLLLFTGYARFFDAETEWCDRVSFWRGKDAEERLLTREVRRRFNGMVDRLNDVVRAAAEVGGARYVDVDELFEGHRFCESRHEKGETIPWFFSAGDSDGETEMDGEQKQKVVRFPLEDYIEMTRAFHPTADGHTAIAKAISQIIAIG